MAQIPKGRLVKGPYKPICRNCEIYFSITVKKITKKITQNPSFEPKWSWIKLTGGVASVDVGGFFNQPTRVNPRRSPPPSFASPGPSPLMTPASTPRGDVSPETRYPTVGWNPGVGNWLSREAGVVRWNPWVWKNYYPEMIARKSEWLMVFCDPEWGAIWNLRIHKITG